MKEKQITREKSNNKTRFGEAKQLQRHLKNENQDKRNKLYLELACQNVLETMTEGSQS